jgi:hypothetical protein
MDQTALPTVPPLLYKFLSLAPGQSPSWQDRVNQLLDGRCFYPGAAAFNDPFDCWPYAKLPDSKAEFESRQQPLVAALAEVTRRDIPADFATEWIRRKLAGKSMSELHDQVQNGLRMNANATGVFCLAACIDSTLMWSHYGWSHRGIALRFDFGRQRYGGLNPLWRVDYQSARPVIRDLLAAGFGDAVPRMLATKSDIWSYEQEWRSMKPDGAGQVVRFNPEVITGVVLGANCSPEDEVWIRGQIGSKGLQLERMSPDPRTFGLNRRPA